MSAGKLTPFSKGNTIRELGESKLIERIRQWLGSAAPRSPEGMGDDCAVIDPTSSLKQILTTDSLTYGQHFDDEVSAKNAGAKLVKRNLSDIAAMGGRPGHALLSLLCGADLNLMWLEEFIGGIRDTCLQYRLPLVGGDISALPEGHFSSVLCLTGYTDQRPLLRRGAKPGDSLYVTGRLGGSRIHKHYSFEPRLAEGQWLAQSGCCGAMMDLTDGLAKDLRELIPERCAALLELDRIPLTGEARQTAVKSGRTPIDHAFCDGEDYELLFSVKGGTDLGQFECLWKKRFPTITLTRIGRFEESEHSGAYLDATTKDSLPWIKGFEHLGGQ